MHVCMYVCMLNVCMYMHTSVEVKDTTGAGDAFIGGFLVALLTQSHTYTPTTRGNTEQEDEELTALLRCLQIGSLVAAEAIKGIGAR